MYKMEQTLIQGPHADGLLHGRHRPVTRHQRYKAHQGEVWSTWGPKCRNDVTNHQHVPAEPEDSANGDKKSAPETMQLDNAPNVAAPQPTDQFKLPDRQR